MKRTRLLTNLWLAAVLLAIAVLASPQEARAADGAFETPSQAFSWYSKGPGIMHLKLMTTNSSPYRTLHDATYGVRDAEGHETPVFYIGEQTSGTSGYVRSLYSNLMPDNSLLYLTNDSKWKPYCLITGGEAQQHDATRNNKDNGYAELDWYYPTTFAGKELTFYVKATLWRDGGSTEAYNRDLGKMEFDDIMLESYDPIFGAEDADLGMIQLPVVSDHVINWIDAKYKNADGGWTELPRITLGKDAYMSFIQLPACEPHDSLTVMANVVSATVDKSNLPDTDWPSKLTGDITLFVGTVGMLHGPKLLTAEVLQGGSVKLEWETDFADAEDLFEGDMFEIQRSLTGKMEDFKSIEEVVIEKDSTHYSYTDTKLIESLTPELIDAKLGIPLVRYRVVRSATKEMWGTLKNPALVYVQPSFSTLALLNPLDPKTQWVNEEEKEIELTWSYKKEQIYTWVWDKRAEMRIDIRMDNSQNQFVDSVSYVLTEDEILAGRKVITLHRSCVKYYPSIVVNTKQSPIGQGKGDIFVSINNSDDFSKFMDRVYNGETHLNAILLNNIDAKSRTIAAEEANPYAGNFNGNGHIVYIDYKMNSQVAGLFRNITDGAAIVNLTVDGSINTNYKFAGGIVGHLIAGTAFIENCTANVNINSGKSGDGTHGGIVALVNEKSNLVISNSYYKGSFVSTNASKPTDSWGGFVGFRGRGSYAQLNNNFFNPANLQSASQANSATFVRCYPDDVLQNVIRDCLFSDSLGTIQGRQSFEAPANRGWENHYPKVITAQISQPNKLFPVSFRTREVNYYYFESSATVIGGSLKATTLQSSVRLEWETTEGTIDYFEVWRRNTTNNEGWEVIATQIVDREYEDRTVSPVFDYLYKVSSNNDCEGIHSTFTKEVKGNCVKTGKVEGYVRFADGTGIPGVTVSASQYGTGADPKKGGKCTTDESGFFSIEGLEYWGYQQGAYQLTLSGVSANDLSEECKGGIPVTFDHQSNYEKNCVFTVTAGVKFSGLVMYRGTSIPVHGAHFLVDNHEVRSGSGPVESDFEGKFSFRMLRGKPHTIQAVMDGHKFYMDGYYYKDNKTEVEFDVDVANIYFYDDTRVKLIGRVAGGKDQGDLPLDNSLSTNNLGDNLKMVLTLEGDNASWLVFDNVNRALTERDTTYIHKKYGGLDKNVYSTRVHTTRHRMEVWPDSLTGEYQVLLPPVKWKIQQITADGYATLFQDGKTSDVIDLTDSLTLHKDIVKGSWRSRANEDITQLEIAYNAKYNRIYRTPVLLERKQVGYEKFDYFGDRIYTAQSLVGDKVKVPLVYQKTTKDDKGKEVTNVVYTFGYPVFNTDRGYPFIISAVERYYYNNDVQSDTVDVVKLDGGFVTIRNGLISGTHRDTLTLDNNGEGYYVLRAAQRPYLMTGKDALCTVTFSMERDGMTYEGQPLKAYTLSQYAKPGAKDYLSVTAPVLVDVLRDPPGGGSSAKLSKGSTLKLSYQMDMSWKAGLSFGISWGSKLSNYTGLVGIGIETGLINLANSDFNTSYDLIFSGSGQRAFSYTMTANEDISTDAGSTMVGAEADVYMGVVTNNFIKPTIAVRAIPDSTFVHLAGNLEGGRMVEIAQGRGDDNGLYHLVRDESVGFGQKVESNFIHSQQYIIKQLIPSLAEQSLSLIYTGKYNDKEKDIADAQTLANSTGKRVYLSLRKPDDKNFGQLNLDPTTKEYVYNSLHHQYSDQSAMNYLIVAPSKENDAEDQRDEIYDYGQLILGWAKMIQQNEQEKLEARELVKNFDVDGGGSMSYSEDFASDYTNSHTFINPVTSFTHNYFSWDDVNDHYGTGDAAIDYLADYLPGMVSIMGQTAAKALASVMKTTTGGVTVNSAGDKKSGIWTFSEFNFAGTKFNFTLTPVLSYSVTPKQSINNKYNRKESFTIKMDKKSHLNFDVLRVKTIDTSDNETTNGNLSGDMDVFLETNFERNVDYMEYFLDRGVGAYDKGDFVYPKSFVYRTRAGATVRPWENERKTKFYRVGSVLDERTKKIENPVIKMDKQSISGVPFDEPARFQLYMTNESEQPEAIGGALQFFTLYLDETTNPKGARLLIDGLPLSRSGITVKAAPGEVTTKTLEVWAGEDFDYEDLTIGLISQGDVQCVQEVAFSVHYLRSAGNVEIATPGDKWIMNTDAPFDAKRGWYMPVIISGFNKNQKNFDHIEFQYKESTRGDDYWTNLCAFYADSTLYRAATGTHEMIPENGNIVTQFYGEGTVMEKAYDLRARLYCRNGNSFITSDSKVLSGIKDTRRPQLFGAPDPKDGIIGPGENIVFNFSEAIEHNYLQQATNFEVIGETNETALSEETSLLFKGTGYAETDARRNFSNKSMTIDLMIRPDDTGSAMPLFSHGIDGHSLQLWLTKNWHLRAVIDSVSFESTLPVKKGTFQQVALILDNDRKQALLYNDSIIGSRDSVAYNGYGTLIFGATNEVDINDRMHYTGRMLEARLWTRAMTESLLNTYGKRQLTGYEMGLADYYPMNDGESKYAVDKAQGANAELHGADWALPQGMSLSLDWEEDRPVKGMQLDYKMMERSAEQDYTLMFWFKTNNRGQGALLSNGSGRKTDDNAPNKFFIGFEGGQLKYRTNGQEVLLGKTYADDRWHHFAITVDRSHKLANIWVDRTLRSTLSTDTLGGMLGKDFYVGNMVWHEAGADVQKLHSQNALTGHIDELCLFAQALPPTLLKNYSTKSPGGLEKGLLVYMGFNRQERQSNNELVLVPYALNQKTHLDMDGKATNKHDTLFVDPVSEVLAHIDRTDGAPVQPNKELRNLNFSFVGRDNQLLVNIDEQDARINKRNLYITVTDIPDLNGNNMASPATVEFFVDRNPLRWERKSWEETIYIYSGEDHRFQMKITNTSGAVHQYTVDNLPRWLKVNNQTGIIDPKSEFTLQFSVNADLNVGTYDEIIYLTDENGLTEPLALTVRKEGDMPSWFVNSDLKHFSMNVVGQVMIGNAIVTDEKDIVAAFDAQGRCMGVADINYNPNTAQSLLFITVFDSTAVAEKPLNFKLWHHQTGQILMLETDRTVKFTPGQVIGSVDDPVVMTAGSLYYQLINIYPGWNWFSFNLDNNAYRNPSQMISQYDWDNGDIITDDTEDFTFIYNKELGKWLSNKKVDKSTLTISPKRSYRLFSHNYFTAEVPGYPLKDESQRTLTVKDGWNNIGYTPMVNLPVATALADYSGVAHNQDVVKSREQFAVFTKTSAQNGYWAGSLEYMKPGEGYMLFRNGKDKASFRYPFYEPGTTFFENTVAQAPPATTHSSPLTSYPHTMSLAASVEGLELQEGDLLLAFSEGELRGAAAAIDSVFYVSIAGDEKAPLSFAIEREGEIIASTAELMVYERNTVSGSPMAPTAINFVQTSLPQHGWYTIEGYKLDGKPARKGVYIYNGKKQVIK